jgi:hypothetical protein
VEIFNGDCITVSAMLSALPALHASVCLLKPAGDEEVEMELMLGSLSIGTSASTEFQPSDAVTNGML